MLLTPSPIGPKQCVAILTFSAKRRITSGRHSPNVNTLNRLGQGGKRPNRSSREVTDGANNQGTRDAQPTTNEVKTKGHIVIPYTQGLCESIRKICGRYGIQTHFKGGNTIRNLLVYPKDKEPMVSKSGAIYWFQCGDLTCDDEYIRETSRTFGERFKEHLKDLSLIHHHSNHTGHTTSQNNFQIIGREGHV